MVEHNGPLLDDERTDVFQGDFQIEECYGGFYHRHIEDAGSLIDI